MMDDLFGNKADTDRSDGDLTQEQLNEISERFLLYSVICYSINILNPDI